MEDKLAYTLQAVVTVDAIISAWHRYMPSECRGIGAGYKVMLRRLQWPYFRVLGCCAGFMGNNSGIVFKRGQCEWMGTCTG